VCCKFGYENVEKRFVGEIFSILKRDFGG